MSDLGPQSPSIRCELPSEEATARFAQRLSRFVRAGDLLVLSGPLGAGKTFFARELCYALGLPQSVRVTSPTFTLVHEFDTEPPISHADLYRLSSEDEVLELGLDEARQQGRLLVVEWGERYVSALGGDALCVLFDLEPRSARLTASGPRSRQLLEQLR